MATLTEAEIAAIEERHPRAMRGFFGLRVISFGLIGLIIAYFVTAWVVFDVNGALSRYNPDRLEIATHDIYAYKIHAVIDTRNPSELRLVQEGMRTAVYEEFPAWVRGENGVFEVDLGTYGLVRARPGEIEVTNANGDVALIQVGNGERESPVLLTPEAHVDAGGWIEANESRVSIRFGLGARMLITRSKVEIFRYFNGWENFWFVFGHPLNGASFSEVWAAALSSEPISERQRDGESNAAFIWRSFWGNTEWQHGEIFEALGLTILMAFLGTLMASMLGLPLAFIAARRAARIDETTRERIAGVSSGVLLAAALTPLGFAIVLAADSGVSGVIDTYVEDLIMLALSPLVLTYEFIRLAGISDTPARDIFGYDGSALMLLLLLVFVILSMLFTRLRGLLVKKAFDFLRAVDTLIWSLIFIRCFGPGPLSGTLAIFVTDTGTLGKLYSEAIENADRRQIEGVSAAGAGPIQRGWFGVFPQILPVFISQGLYFLESNTRSATIIGILGAGGIGLKLADTMRTGRDWENAAYIILLIILVVIAMDNLSAYLRRRLIRGGAPELEAIIERQRARRGQSGLGPKV